MAILVTCILIINLLLGHEAYSSPPAAIILTPPQSVTVIEGDTTVFTCTVRAKEITIFVNGVKSSQSSVTNQGFIEGFIVDISETTKQQSLTALAVANNNNTNITCRALTIDGTDVSLDISDLAVLLIQGPLSAVVDLSYSFINSSTVTISWSPPFTLPGTDITGYNISVTSNGTTTNYFTSNSYYQLSLTDITDSSCDIEIISVNVSGFNGLEGESTLISFEPTVDAIPVSLNSFVRISELYSIKLELIVSSIYSCQYPTYINLTIQYSNNGSLVTTIDNIPVAAAKDNADILVSDDVTVHLPNDSDLTAVVTFNNFDTNNSIFAFRTHTTLTATVASSIGPYIEFVCHFYPESDATGCYIELLLTNSSDTVQYTGTANRTGTDQANVTIHGVNTEGLYRVYVYEIEGDGSTVLVSRMDILIAIIQPTYTTGSSLPLPMTTPSISIPNISVIMNDSPSMNVFPYAISSIVLGVLLLIVILFVTVSTLVYVYRRYQSKMNYQENFNINMNSAYVNPRTIVSHLQLSGLVNVNEIMSVDQNPSYSQVQMVKKEKHIYDNVTSVL